MDTTRFDRISKRFAQRRLSRREALALGAAGLAGTFAAAGLTVPASAQDATPEAATETAGKKTEFLFVQTYQSGTIAPVEGVDDRYILTLEAGSGQTVYFSDRPERIVGATETPDFLEGLGFPDDNPPNAALVVETAPGVTDVAVIELFSPLYDPVSQGVIYEVEVLANWASSLEMGFSEAPTDLAALAPAFGSAHLFIDGCDDDAPLSCAIGYNPYIVSTIGKGEYGGWCYDPGSSKCVPCIPDTDSLEYWSRQCNERIPNCQNKCRACRNNCIIDQ